MDAPTAPPPPVRPRGPLIAVLAVAVILAGVALVGGGLALRSSPGSSASPLQSGSQPPGSQPPGSGPPVSEPPVSVPPSGSASVGYLVSPADLADRIAKATQGVEPWSSAMAELVADADDGLAASPHPAAHLDIPGTEGPFVDDTATAYGLALAYAATGDKRYAKGARDYIMAWVDTTEELVNACPEHGGCQTSLIVARVVPAFVFAADLIRPSGAFSTSDDVAFRAWLKDLILPDLPTRDGNWGDAGDFSRATITDYLGDQAGFQAALDEWRARMDVVPADGDLPDEVRRGSEGLSYTQEAIQYKIGVARLAELRGVDLWSYRGKGGATLKTAIDLLAKYGMAPEDWPFAPDISVPSPSPMWEIAYQHWKDPIWPRIFAGDRPFGKVGHSAIRWTTMTNGIQVP